MKSIMIALLAILFLDTAQAQTNKTQQGRKINGQDSAPWHQPRRDTRDTPRNGAVPMPDRKNMQPKGINPDSTHTPSAKPLMK